MHYLSVVNLLLEDERVDLAAKDNDAILSVMATWLSSIACWRTSVLIQQLCIIVVFTIPQLSSRFQLQPLIRWYRHPQLQCTETAIDADWQGAHDAGGEHRDVTEAAISKYALGVAMTGVSRAGPR
jgi:hypothetical protein